MIFFASHPEPSNGSRCEKSGACCREYDSFSDGKGAFSADEYPFAQKKAVLSLKHAAIIAMKKFFSGLKAVFMPTNGLLFGTYAFFTPLNHSFPVQYNYFYRKNGLISSKKKAATLIGYRIRDGTAAADHPAGAAGRPRRKHISFYCSLKTKPLW